MATSISPKREMSDLFARVAKALANGIRLELVEALGQGERSVEELGRAVGIPIANASHHLQVLREGGIVASRRDGVQIIYRLADDEVVRVVRGIRRIAERQIAEVERVAREHFASRDGLQPVRRADLLRLVRRGDAVVIDVRPVEEYAAGHIPGAVNIPSAELPRRLAGLPRDKEIVAYCRGPYCVLAFDAVATLRGAGYRARRLEDGWPEWKASSPAD